MIMLHSVWSGEESVNAPNARRKATTMLAVLALLASVLMWATPQAVAQNGSPIALLQAHVGSTPDDAEFAKFKLEDGVSASAGQRVQIKSISQHETSGTALTQNWKIETGPYSWIDIRKPDGSPPGDGEPPAASLEGISVTLPNQSYIDVQVSDSDPDKYRIVVTLTVTDARNNSDSEQVVININRKPEADVTVGIAGLLDKAFATEEDAQPNELFGTSAIIDGPGENGNRDNEWDIREGAYLVLDASGSAVPGGQVGKYDWRRTFILPSGQEGFANTQEGASPTLVVGTGNAYPFDPDGDGTPNSECDVADADCFARLPDLDPGESVRVNYTLEVTGAGSTRTNTYTVRLVIHADAKDVDPISVSVVPTAASAGRGAIAQSTTSALNGGVDNQWLVSAGSVVQLTASNFGDDATKLRWTGAAGSGSTVTRRIPAVATAGTTYDVTVTDGTRTTTVQLVVGNNQAPTADAVSADGPEFQLVGPNNDLQVLFLADGVQPDRQPITLRGVGNDPDGGSLIEAWTVLDFPADQATNAANLLDIVSAFEATPADDRSRFFIDLDPGDRSSNNDAVAFISIIQTILPELTPSENPAITLVNPVGDTVSFEVPEVSENTGVFISYSVTDSAFVTATKVVYIHIKAGDDKPVANAGSNQQVSPGSFVRLSGKDSSDPDKGEKPTKYEWTYVKGLASPLPGPGGLGALTDSEIKELDGWIVRKASPDEISNPEIRKLQNSKNENYVYIVKANGDVIRDADKTPANLKGNYKENSNRGVYPYFDAPKLGRFNSIALTFHLVVTDESKTPAVSSTPTPVTITVAQVDRFYSGSITGPDFCTNRSFGGPSLYAHDGDGDGIAETCSLNTTRRHTVARQNALEAIAALNPVQLANQADAWCKANPTASYPGDDPADLAKDVCANGGVLAAAPAVRDTTKFGPVITGPDFCTNFSLGGPVTYPHDSDGDGIYDICSLNSTRREAVARQAALESFKDSPFSAEEQTRHDELTELLELEAKESLETAETTKLATLRNKYAAEFDVAGGTDDQIDTTAETAAVQAEITRLASKKAVDDARYPNALAAACRALAGQSFEGDKVADLARDGCAPRVAAGVALPS